MWLWERASFQLSSESECCQLADKISDFTHCQRFSIQIAVFRRPALVSLSFSLLHVSVVARRTPASSPDAPPTLTHSQCRIFAIQMYMCTERLNNFLRAFGFSSIIYLWWQFIYHYNFACYTCKRLVQISHCAFWTAQARTLFWAISRTGTSPWTRWRALATTHCPLTSPGTSERTIEIQSVS